MPPMFELREVAPQATAVIRAEAPIAEIGAVLAEVFPAIDAFLRERGIAAVGRPFTRYLEMGEERASIEAGIGVASTFEGAARIEAGELPGGRVASALHTGPYDQLRFTYEALMAWMAKHGHMPAGAFWEVYVTDPEAEPNAEKWVTEVNMPIR